MKLYTTRLTPGSDLRQSLGEFAQAHHLRAGSIVTCVGALQKAVLRMAGATPANQDVRTFNSDFEIVSLVGTISINGLHLHASLSDAEGNVIGGHLKNGSIVGVTAEIVIAEDEAFIYERAMDDATGFEELTARPRH
jgi:uncharacterized protein